MAKNIPLKNQNVSEDASCGGTSSSGIASVSSPLLKKPIKRKGSAKKNQGVYEGAEIKIPTEDGITWQDIRLIAGEGKLSNKTKEQAISVIRKQRRQDNRLPLSGRVNECWNQTTVNNLTNSDLRKLLHYSEKSLNESVIQLVTDEMKNRIRNQSRNK